MGYGLELNQTSFCVIFVNVAFKMKYKVSFPQPKILPRPDRYKLIMTPLQKRVLATFLCKNSLAEQAPPDRIRLCPGRSATNEAQVEVPTIHTCRIH